jgi:hypothetical protein
MAAGELEYLTVMTGIGARIGKVQQDTLNVRKKSRRSR